MLQRHYSTQLHTCCAAAARSAVNLGFLAETADLLLFAVTVVKVTHTTY